MKDALIVSLLFSAITPGAVHAAESYDNCTGFIDSLPASISTQGTWCLRKHLYTSMTSGAAITLAADNITIDCNDFRLSGLGAGAGTDVHGVSAGASRQNATIRQCRIQGFKRGVLLYGAGHLVEDSRFDGNTYVGIHTSGDGIVIRGNFVNDTGGRTDEQSAFGILSNGTTILDNVVSGVSPLGHNNYRTAFGIAASYSLVQGNRVEGMNGDFVGAIRGDYLTVRDNAMAERQAVNGDAIHGGLGSLCQNNTARNYGNGIVSCTLSGANGVIP